MEQIDDKGGTYQKHSFVCQQPGYSILERPVEAGAVYHGIISQMVIDMFIYAFRIPYVRDSQEGVGGLLAEWRQIPCFLRIILLF